MLECPKQQPTLSRAQQTTVLVILFWTLIGNLNTPRLLASEVDLLLMGAISRAKSIESGRIEYRFESGIVGSKVAHQRRLPTKALSFAGTDWIERERGGSMVLINRAGVFFEFDEIAQPDGSLQRTVVMSQPRSFQDQADEDRRPWYAGTFWHTQQLEYVDQHRSRCRLGTPQNVDGSPCKVCELEVPPNDVAAAFLIRIPLLTAGGTLRMYIAPDLGFALPLIEVISSTNVRVIAYESKDFREFPRGTYSPRQSRKELRTTNGAIEYEQFTIAPELINQPIPASEFEMKFPAGTRVLDKRDISQVRRFTLSDESTTLELGGPSSARHPVASAPTDQTPRSRFLTLIGILFFLFVLVLAVWRLRHRAWPNH